MPGWSTRLALSLVSHPDEAIDSYVERLAWHNRCSVAAILERVGISSGTGYRQLPAGYWVTLDPIQAARFADATGVAPSKVSAMTLTAFNGVCLRLEDRDTASTSVRHLALREWAYFSSSHVCPGCLREGLCGEPGAAWSVRWRLPWTFACPRHDCLLVDTCPGCAQRIRGATRRTIPAFAARVLPPGICRNPRRPAAENTPAEPCGTNLSHCAATTISEDSPIIAAQQTINAALTPNHRQPAARAEWFSDLRSLCALILTAAEPQDINGLDPTLDQAFNTYVAARQHRDQQRTRLRRAGPIRGGAPRLRPYTHVPEQTPLLAALLSSAVPILDCASIRQRRHDLAWLIERLRARDRKALTQLPKRMPMSPRLADTLSPLLSVHVPAELEALRGNSRDDHRFEAIHVPQLLWDELFTDCFAHLLSDTKRDFARRFCAMAIIRYRHGHTWKTAAELLELPQTAIGLAAECTLRLRHAGRQAEFTATLEQAARWIDDRPLIDYASRRGRLRELVDIPRDRWLVICDQAAVPPGRPEGRRYAAAWLWCQLTEGDYRLAPALQQVTPEPGHRHVKTQYTRWTKHASRIAPLARPLHAYGDTFLDSNGV